MTYNSDMRATRGRERGPGLLELRQGPAQVDLQQSCCQDRPAATWGRSRHGGGGGTREG